MARTIEDIVKDQVGSLFIQYAATLAQVEALVERVKELESQVPEKVEDK